MGLERKKEEKGREGEEGYEEESYKKQTCDQ